MKPITHRLLAAGRWFTLACCCHAAHATVTLNANNTFTTAPPSNGDLTIAGDLGVLKGIDFGVTTTTPPLAAVQLNYFGGTANTAMFDVTAPLGSFQWRDNLLGAAKTKMKLDSTNTLTLYQYNGTTGILLNPNTSQISLPSTGGGIYAGTTPVFTIDATGKLVFGNCPASFTNTLILANTTAATSSTTGALTIAGGLGVAQDAYINGVRVGRGGGTNANSCNTALGNGTLQLNSIKGIWNTAVGYNSLYSNCTGKNNTATGYQALYANATGSNNVAIGMSAGSFQMDGTPLSAAQNSIYIGAGSKGYSNNDVNSIVIGTDGAGEGAYTTVIGNASTNTTHIYGLSVALGHNSRADGLYAAAIQAHAAGNYSFAACGGIAAADNTVALAYGLANGSQSLAIGGTDADNSMCSSFIQNCSIGKHSVTLGGCANIAYGTDSYALGNRVTALDSYAFVIGSQNLSRGGIDRFFDVDYYYSDSVWNEESPVFELGNGNPECGNGRFNGSCYWDEENYYYVYEFNPIELSNAITTLKNGRTTLTNKAWLASVAADASQVLADPPPATDSGGEALVVEGHTRLKGKVIIEQAQGDISMGIYGP
ncbi:MAG: hypothetical protein WCJ14_03260 [Verrucomicrobiota bacterium]